VVVASAGASRDAKGGKPAVPLPAPPVLRFANGFVPVRVAFGGVPYSNAVKGFLLCGVVSCWACPGLDLAGRWAVMVAEANHKFSYSKQTVTFQKE